MKPHIRWLPNRRVYCCRGVCRDGYLWLGHGYTPEEAYVDWKQQGSPQ